MTTADTNRGRGGMKMPDTNIAITLYTLREHCQTEAGLEQTLKTLRGMGYRAIQISGVPLAPGAVREIAMAAGCYICGAHEGLEDLRNDFAGVVKKLQTWDCDFTALGHPGEAFSVEPRGAGKLIAELDGYGKKLMEQHIRFGYHNHHTDFARIEHTDRPGAGQGHETFMDYLFRATDPRSFFWEIDVHWVQRGGQSPVDWIRKLAGRMPLCHFKDFAIVGGEPIFCEVGEGNLDWPAIIAACEKAGVRWYVVEQDSPIEGRDIFESVEISYRNLKKLAGE